jgi:hypothetical protein
VQLGYIWRHSVYREENEAVQTRREALLPQMVESLREAGYWVSEPDSMHSVMVRRRAPNRETERK